MQLCILLLLSLWGKLILGKQYNILRLVLYYAAPVPASSLPGSCVEAGYTECCDSALQGDCLAEPTYCLCDPSCRQFNDCCDDIDEICPPGTVSLIFYFARTVSLTILTCINNKNSYRSTCV